MKKIAILLFVLCLLTLSVSALDASIDSAEEMLALMNAPSAWGGSYTLSCEIDLASAAGQTAIGTAETPFTGSFDGNGHAIKGILLETENAPAWGLFGYVDGATIRNLTTYGKVASKDATDAGTDTAGTGGIVGCAWGKTTLENLTNYCTVDGVNKVGGIVGGVHSNTLAGDQSKVLRNLKNYGNICGEKMLGGIAARMVFSSDDITHTIENLYNAGDITVTIESGSYYAGIVALVYSNQTPILFDNCQNDGDLTTPGRVGGIVGFFRNYSTDPEKLVFRNCVNNGTITASGGYVGGIFSYCGNSGTTVHKGTFENCYSAGKIVTAATNFVEPIGAVPRTCVIADCYYTAEVGGSATHGFLITEAGDVADRLTADEGWILESGTPELAAFHTHTLGAYAPTTDGGHARSCYCGYTTATEAHTFVDTVCTVCGASSCAHDGAKTYKSTKTPATCIAGGIDIYTCGLCGYDFEVETAEDANAHSGGIVLSAAAGKADYACADCGHIYVSRTETDVYVSASGATAFTAENVGSIGTADAPFGSFTDAMAHAAAIAAMGITVQVHITDSATVPTDYVSPDFDGAITVSGGTLRTGNRFVAGGTTTIEHTVITPSTALLIVARGNKFVLGEGITMGNTRDVYVIGGWDTRLSTTADVPLRGYATDLTVRSGRYAYIIGGNRGLAAEYNGEIRLTVGKSDPADTLTVTEKLCGASIDNDLGKNVKLTLHFDGDVDFATTGDLFPFCGAARCEHSNFDADIVIQGKLTGIDGVQYNAASYTADLYADTAIAGMEKVLAVLGEGEVQVHPLEAYTDPNYTPAVQTAVRADTAYGEVGIHTYTYGNVRITVLSDTAVRVEEAEDGAFVDAATLTVPHREKFGGTAIQADSDGATVVLETAKIVINLPIENATAADVKIFDKTGNLLFDYYNACHRGTYSSLPAPSATPQTYMLFDNGILPAKEGMVYVGSEDATSDWRVSGNIDYYVLCPFGDSAALRRDFVTLTGSTYLSDIKFYGSWYSRWSSFTDEQKLAMIEEYRDHDVPLDVIVIDTEWKTGEDGTGYTVNTALYPDMEGFLAKAEAAGVYVLFNDHTHKTSMTILTPEEFKWQCAGILSLMELGLDGWWYDRNWSYTIQSPYTDLLYSTVGQILYYDTMAKYHRDTAENGEAQRVLMLTNADWLRHGYIEGHPSVIGHRYGMQWTGDIYGDIVSLSHEIENAVVAGVRGASPHISADLGGFRNNDHVSENAFIRWMQFASFAGAVRVHSDINPKNPHYPWSYTAVAETAVRNYLHMRYHLMPYHYALARECYDSGMPILRRLDFHYPAYEESQDNTRYLLGEDILVAPYTGTPIDGAAVVPASWLRNAAGETGLDVAYYDTTGRVKAEYFTGTPAATDTVQNMSFFWDRSSPNSVGDEYFGARFTGTITPEIDCYIGIIVDDGGRVYIDGELFAGSYTNRFDAPEMNTETVLKAGESHEIVIEYYEATSKAQLHFVYAPATAENASSREVFIPDGEWIDVFTGEVITGPKTVTVTKDVYSSPIFVRKGAVIPAAAVVSPMTNADWENLSLNLYGLGEGSTVLYEDDGRTESYQDGECRKTAVNVGTAGDVTTLTVGAAEGDFATEYTVRNITVRVHSDTPITFASVNGIEAEVTKIERDASALPFADSGASAISDVYVITFAADVQAEHTVVLSTAERIAGDANGDGYFTVADALTALRAYFKGTVCGNADLNGDGKLTLADILKLLKMLVA